YGTHGVTWDTTAKVNSRVRCPNCGQGRTITRADRPVVDEMPDGWADDLESGFESDDDASSDGLPTGWQCAECGAATYWLGARAGTYCDNGHAAPSPEAQDRAISVRQSQDRERARAERESQPDTPVRRTAQEIRDENEFTVTRARMILPLSRMRQECQSYAER